MLINLGASCLVQELIKKQCSIREWCMSQKRGEQLVLCHIEDPLPTFGNENAERFTREAPASDKREQENSLSTHQFSLPRKKPTE